MRIPEGDGFIWAVGIEDTFVAHARSRFRALDEYELMGHYEHWKEDLSLVRDLGVQAVRWGVPWHRVEPEPGRFDWSWIDRVIPYLVDDLGVAPIIDLVHYGCPLWLPRAFADPEYPAMVATFARAFAERYCGDVHWYTPLNEPTVTAAMCGRLGVWPPYLRGERGFLRVMVQVARGQSRTMSAIRAVDPASVFVSVEAATLVRAAAPYLADLASEDQTRAFLGYDLLDGRVVPGHPLFTWLIRKGIRPDHLEELAADRVSVDIMGLNFYPQWSTRQIYVTRGGRVSYRSTECDGTGFAQLIESFYQRYRVPVMVTETSAFGPDEVRARWLDASLAAVKHLRARGIPVIGYTWFPLFTMIDWRYRYGTAPASRYRLDLGLYRLADSATRWQATPLAERFRRHACGPTLAPYQSRDLASGQ